MTEGDRLAAERSDGSLFSVPENEIYVRFVTVPQSTLSAPLLRVLQPASLVRPALHVEHAPHPNIGRAVYEAWESGYIP